MRTFQFADDAGAARKGLNEGFGGALRRESSAGEKPKPGSVTGGSDVLNKSGDGFSSGGLDAPDGQTRDPFPPSLVAYIEILRSVAAYLRDRNSDGGGGSLIVDKTAPPKDEVDVAEPTTFAIGEEESADCGGPADVPDATTLAVGEEDGSGPIPVEPDGGIGDGAGPIPFPPEATTLAIGEEDGGASL